MREESRAEDEKKKASVLVPGAKPKPGQRLDGTERGHLNIALGDQQGKIQGVKQGMKGRRRRKEK